jgi:hypothetical protein
MGLRKIRRCKGCGRKFTPKSQKLIEAEAPESVQPGCPESIEVEATVPEEPRTVEPADSELPASTDRAVPSDEHPRFGL